MQDTEHHQTHTSPLRKIQRGKETHPGLLSYFQHSIHMSILLGDEYPELLRLVLSFFTRTNLMDRL